MITLDEMKGYLRVDYDDDDKLISELIETSKGICMDVLRASDEDALLKIPAAKTAILYSTAYLYEHRERIMADSRMFLTPLPFKNGLAYTGTSGLDKATLGVYLEWWNDCPQAVIRKEEQVDALTYHIAGSPLSGANHCSAVDREGRSVTMHFSPFSPIWSSFRRINQRYTEAKQRYQSYTLEETIAKLREA